MGKRLLLAGALAPAILLASPVSAEQFLWGIQGEQLEYRIGEDNDVLAWDFDAIAGTDELKFVWRSEAEFSLEEDAFETLENQARLQVPISDFFNAVAGVRVDTPGGPDRVYGVLGFHGLAKQWFEVDADLFLGEDPSARFEVEYEGLITNRVTLVPSIEVDLPFTDDEDIGTGAWGPTLEVGARLSYDLIDRAISPYIGVHYERAFGETADLARDDGEDDGAVFFVIGTRILF
ncbi:copper resistance protein B [Pelagibius sp. Alg239-R121]|uniref:copper resistance protein B n=1 Tax=Pelagibius sp. Alg239-R121 TaxID=2993448 RepID=UPI0024A79A03|nr:copper resistance protein B [Pelagibius sp. Alg239-R121]